MFSQFSVSVSAVNLYMCTHVELRATPVYSTGIENPVEDDSSYYCSSSREKQSRVESTKYKFFYEQ